VDVASDAQVQAWAARLIKAYGPPDLVLNNAGVINRNARLRDIPEPEFSQVIEAGAPSLAGGRNSPLTQGKGPA
jgi:NAD(P)-dependent dehydrogenase (short-subunit alcohol dehydrogenase family)